VAAAEAALFARRDGEVRQNCPAGRRRRSDESVELRAISGQLKEKCPVRDEWGVFILFLGKGI
jgi:hypothetical protein